MTDSTVNTHKPNGKFAKGNKANPKGRPRGHRDRLTAKVWADLLYAWEKGGVDALARMMEHNPSRFVTVIASVLPKEEQRKEIAHTIEISLKQPDWVKLTDTQSEHNTTQLIDIVKDSVSEDEA